MKKLKRRIAHKNQVQLKYTYVFLVLKGLPRSRPIKKIPPKGPRAVTPIDGNVFTMVYF